MIEYQLITESFELKTFPRYPEVELVERHRTIQLDLAYKNILELRAEKRVVYIVKKHKRFENGYYKQYVIHDVYTDEEDANLEALSLNCSPEFHYTTERLEAK